MEVSQKKKACFFICANTDSVVNLQSLMHLAQGSEQVVCAFDFLEMDETQEQGWAKQDQEQSSIKKKIFLCSMEWSCTFSAVCVSSGWIAELYVLYCATGALQHLLICPVDWTSGSTHSRWISLLIFLHNVMIFIILMHHIYTSYCYSQDPDNLFLYSLYPAQRLF